jgi:anti-sigma B factor antagonist
MTPASPAPWTLQIDRTADAVAIRLAGQDISLDEINAKVMGEKLFRLVEDAASSRFSIDFASVTFLTSSALGILLHLHKKLKTGGGRLELRNVAPHIFEIFSITRLDQVFDVLVGQAALPVLR